MPGPRPGERALRDGDAGAIDLRRGSHRHDPVADGASWGSRRQIRAEVLREVVLAPTGDGPVHPVHVIGARIVGALDLSGQQVRRPLLLEQCFVDEDVQLDRATLDSLSLRGSRVPKLHAVQVHVTGNLTLDEGFAATHVELRGARIDGFVSLARAHLTNPTGVTLEGWALRVGQGLRAAGLQSRGAIRLIGAHIEHTLTLTGADLVNEHGWALDAQGMTVGYALFLGNSLSDANGLTVEGGLRLIGVQVNGFLSLRGAQIMPHQRWAIAARGLTVESDLLMGEGFAAEGQLNLVGLRVGYEWILSGSLIQGSAKSTVAAEQAVIGGSVLCTGLTSNGIVDLGDAQVAMAVNLTGAEIAGPGAGLVLRQAQLSRLVLPDDAPISQVDLRHARIQVLEHRPQAGSPPMRVRDLGYDTVAADPPATVRDHLDWLARDPDGYAPQPYEQLASSYRRVGDESAARTVAVAALTRQRRTLRPAGRMWSRLLQLTVGYGYRTWQAGLWLLALIAPGALAFWRLFPAQLAPATDHPAAFQPVVYTIDVLLPVVDLGQQSDWNATGAAAWLAWSFIALGWVLTTSVAAGLARVLRRA